MSSQAEQSSFVLTRRLADGTVEWIPLEVPQRVPAAPGAAYALIDRTDYEAPQTLVAQRQGEDLVIEVNETEVLVLDGFFATLAAAFYPTTDIASGAGPFSGPPLTPDSPVLTGSPEGEQVVWSAEQGDGDARGDGGEQVDGVGSPALWGGLAGGGLLLALAAGGGGGGGGGNGGGSDGPDTSAPQITSGATAAAIDENSGAGQVVHTAAATDEGTVTWSLEDSGDGSRFSIDATTGAVTLTEDPDFEMTSSYTFTVVATDDAGNSSTRTVSLAINDLEEAGPTITSGATAEDIDENSGPGQVIYDAEATADGTVTWSLEDSGDAAHFSIDASTGAVALTDDPDHEVKSSYTFTVVATDADGNSSTRTVSLAINDLDEVAPTITSGATAPVIHENSGAGQVVYTVTSTDDGDISTGSTTYSLSPVGDADHFTIEADTGAVTLIDDPDFETKSSYSFTVVATDAAGNSSEQAVSLAINDLDDAPSVEIVELTSAVGAQNGILNEGDIVSVTVTMSGNVTVDTSGGTPRIALDIGGATVFADYVSGSGSTSLIFEYTIQPGDNDSNGIGIQPNSLELNGGSLTDSAGNAADLKHGRVPDDDSFIVDTTAPTLSSSTPADDATDVPVGDDIVLTFSENVAVGSGNITISDGSDTRTIDVTDSSQISVSGNQVTIDPASDLNAVSTYNVQIDSGALTDEAGNAYAGISDSTTLNFETEIDTSIVVFDLVQGSSSDHSDRIFDGDVSYDIYIRVDSDDATLSTEEDGPGTWGIWSGAANLGSDDRVILVGDGAPVQGRIFPVNHVSVDPTAVAWRTALLLGDAGMLQERSFTRAAGGEVSDARLFDTPLPAAFLSGQGGQTNTMHLANMPAGILTSQGLV